MKELDDELWKLGVPAKTKHNEVAPSQHELAPIFEQGDARHRRQPPHDGECIKLLATRHGLACLEHEKPFEYVNGIGQAQQLVHLPPTARTCSSPATVPSENLQFLVFLACAHGRRRRARRTCCA